MAVTITVSEVKNGFETTVNDTEIGYMITFVDQADECLDANSVADDVQRLLKINGVRHMCAMQANSGAGSLQSQQAPSGAGRSFQTWNPGSNKTDINSTRYGALVKQMDTHGCVVGVINNSNLPDIKSVGCL